MGGGRERTGHHWPNESPSFLRLKSNMHALFPEQNGDISREETEQRIHVYPKLIAIPKAKKISQDL